MAYCFRLPTMVRKRRLGEWTEAEEERLRQLAKNGDTQRQAAAALGRSYNSIRYKARGMQLAWAKTHKAWSASEVRILRKLAMTLTVAQVAVELGRGVAAVQQKAGRLNISFRKSGEYHTAAKLSRAQVGEVFALKEQGWTQRKIANQFGVDHSCVGAILNFETRFRESLQILHVAAAP